jgi:hypothetical protein
VPGIGLSFVVVLARVCKDSNRSEGVVPVVSRMAGARETGNICRRFVGGSARNRALLGQSCNSVHYMQIAQNRINTGYFASH